MSRKAKAKWKSSTNRWQVTVRKNGLRRSFYSKTSAAEAEKKAEQWDGTPPVRKQPQQDMTGLNETGFKRRRREVPQTVDEAFNIWFPDDVKVRTSESNWRGIESRYKNWIQYVIGNVPLSEICDADLQDVIDNAFNRCMAPEAAAVAAKTVKHCKDGKMSKKSLMKIKGDLTKLFRYCRSNKWTTYVPEYICIPKEAACVGKEVLEENDIAKLLGSTTTQYRGKYVFDEYVYAYRFQMATGLRPGELLGLRWEDVAPDNSRIHVQRAINILGESTNGKNANANRVIPLCAEARQALEDQLGLDGGHRTGSVFKISNEKLYYKRLKRFCQVNGMTAVSPYELRHTFVSMNKALPVGYLKSVVGHSASMDTLGTYGHHLDRDDAKIAELVDMNFAAVSSEQSAGA